MMRDLSVCAEAVPTVALSEVVFVRLLRQLVVPDRLSLFFERTDENNRQNGYRFRKSKLLYLSKNISIEQLT
jgi:hypothetical protein